MQTTLMIMTFLLGLGGLCLLFSGRSSRQIVAEVKDVSGRQSAPSLSFLKKFQQLCENVEIGKMKKMIKANGTSWLTEQAKAQALHLAVSVEDRELACMMLEAGADTEFLVDGSTALEQACALDGTLSSLTDQQRQDFFAIFDLLLQYGADANGKDCPPLFDAIHSRDILLAQKLLDAGADINKMSDEITALEYAKFSKQDEMARWLQEHGAK